MHDDTKADAPLTPDEERALREAWASIGAWEPRDGQDEGATYVCPLCNGEGETEGVILDATKPFAATLNPCGIGPGLAAAELVAGSTGRLLATVDSARLERDIAAEALRREQAAAVEGLARELAMTRNELVGARIGAGLYTRALGRIEAALGLTGATLGETVNRVEALRLELVAAREHLALVIKYYEAEAREGDGVTDAHWDGLMAAKAFLAAARGER